MSTKVKNSIRWLVRVAGLVAAASALLWTASAIAQTPPPSPAVSPWLTPTAVYGGLTLMAGVIGWVVRWSSAQDKRIDAAATKEDVSKAVSGLRDAIQDLGKVVLSAQSRDACASHRERERADLSDLGRETAARASATERKMERVLERLDGVAIATQGLAEVRQMVSMLYQAGGFTPLPAPRPVGRQITQPLPPIDQEPDKEG